VVCSLRGDASFTACGWCSSHETTDVAKGAAIVRAAATLRAGLIHPRGCAGDPLLCSGMLATEIYEDHSSCDSGDSHELSW
jgi:hypothetical protein